MTDVHNASTRSYNMSRIRSTNSKPEMLVRNFLWHRGVRYRINYKGLPGKPDVVISSRKVVIFVHGCFWHGHEGCRYFKIPQTNTAWWEAKISETKRRDARNTDELSLMGWKVISIYECELKKEIRSARLEALIAEIY